MSERDIRKPIDDYRELFPHRKALCEQLVIQTKKKADKGPIFAVTGERGSGKTSFLKAYLSKLEEEKIKAILLQPVKGEIFKVKVKECKRKDDEEDFYLNPLISTKDEGSAKEPKLDEAILSIHKTSDRWRMASLIMESLADVLKGAENKIEDENKKNEINKLISEMKDIAAKLEAHDIDFIQWVFQIADSATGLFEHLHQLAMERPKAAEKARVKFEEAIKKVKKYFEGDVIIIVIDDLDLAPARAQTIIEDLWTYLSEIKDLVIVVAFDRPSLHLVIKELLKQQILYKGPEKGDHLIIDCPEVSFSFRRPTRRPEESDAQIITDYPEVSFSYQQPARKPENEDIRIIEDLANALILKTFDRWFPLSLLGTETIYEIIEARMRMKADIELSEKMTESSFSSGLDSRESTSGILSGRVGNQLSEEVSLFVELMLCAWNPRYGITNTPDENDLSRIRYLPWARDFITMLSFSTREFYDFLFYLKINSSVKIRGISWNEWNNEVFKQIKEEKDTDLSEFKHLVSQCLARSILILAYTSIRYPWWPKIQLVSDDPVVLFEKNGDDPEKITKIKKHFKENLLVPSEKDVGLFLEEGFFYYEYSHQRLKTKKTKKTETLSS